MSRIPLARLSTVAFAIAFAVLIVVCGLALRGEHRLEEATRSALHTRDVLVQSQLLYRLLAEAEAGALGYVIAGEVSFLDSYEHAGSSIRPAFERLRALCRDDLDQERRISTLEPILQARLDQLEGLIETRRNDGAKDAFVLARSGLGRDTAEQIRSLLAELDASGQATLDERNGLGVARASSSRVVLLALAVSALLLLLVALWLNRWALKELRGAESIARLEGARLRVTLQSCGDALIATDVAGNIVLINPVAQALTGWREEQARGLPIDQVFRIVNEFTRESVENPVSRALREGKVVGLANHTVLIARDNSERPIDDSGAPIKDENGESIGVILVFRDVSGRKLAEQARERLLRAESEREAAVEANQAKDEFLAVVSHELRSPLAAMRGWLDLLNGGLLQESEVPGALHRVHRNVRLQERLISDLLDVSRIIAGKLEILRSPVDLAEIARAAVEECRSGADQKGVSLLFEPAPARVLVLGDEHRLTQVVSNVVGNGIKFTRPGGSVRVQLDRQDGQTLVTVSDTGVGMTAEVIDRLFERFWQADSSRSRREGGLGLGLAIVKHLVDEHEGTIRAESPGAGRGSTFVIELPLLDAGPVAVVVPPEERPTNLLGIQILVVDDDADSRDSLSLYLRKRGAIVTDASSTPEALQAYEAERPMVVISDIGMPDEDGFALASALRERDARLDTATPMIALTGFASADHRRAAIEHGFDAHLAKPVDLDQLAALIERLVGKR